MHVLILQTQHKQNFNCIFAQKQKIKFFQYIINKKQIYRRSFYLRYDVCMYAMETNNDLQKY